MQPVIIAMTLATALSVYWIMDNAECLLNPESADGWKGYAYEDELELIEKTNEGGSES